MLRSARPFALVAAAMVLCGCNLKASDAGAESFGAPTATVALGTAEVPASFDPAGLTRPNPFVADIYQTLLQTGAGPSTTAPEAASCISETDTTLACTLVPGQAFSNGDPLTAQDVVFSFRRILAIDQANGPANLLASLKDVSASGNTVTFTLDASDPTWPMVLTDAATSIVDSNVFPAKKLLDADLVVGSGPYRLSTYVPDQVAEFTPNPHYGGSDHLANAKVVVKFDADGAALLADLKSGAIDLAYRGLSPLQAQLAQQDAGVSVFPGGDTEIRGVAFDPKRQPGTNDAHKLAVRQAVAELVDRTAIVSTVYHGAVSSLNPTGTQAPDAAAAEQTLAAAGITPTVPMTLWYNADHLGDTDLAAELARELNTSGLFEVTLKTADWSTYDTAARSGSYGVFLYGWYSGQAQTHLAEGVPVIPIWQGGQVAAVRSTTSGAQSALGPSAIRFWLLG